VHFLEKFIIENNLGDYASVLGLFISVIGFIFTLINVTRARNASIAAASIAKQVREDLSKFDTISLISSTISVMDEIKRLHRQGAWEILPDRYSAIKKALITIRSSNPNLADVQKSAIQSAILNFTSIEKQVESAIFNKTHPENVDKINTLISKQVDILQEIFIGIKNKIGE
jgi:hypothetical protein